MIGNQLLMTYLQYLPYNCFSLVKVDTVTKNSNTWKKTPKNYKLLSKNTFMADACLFDIF